MKTKPKVLKTTLIECQHCSGKGMNWRNGSYGRCGTCGGKGVRYRGNDGQYYAGHVGHGTLADEV